MDLSPSVVFAIIAMSMVASCLVFAVIQEATVRLRGTNRVRGLPGFIGINIIVLGAGAAALQWLPQWSGLLVVGTFIVLVAPGLLQLTAEALVFRGDHKAAAVAARSAYLLWPSAKRRFNAAVCAASADGSIEQKVEALRTLAPRATPQQQMLLESWVASLQDDWKPFLDRLDTIDGEWPSQLHFVVIYALGELGRGDETAQAFSRSKMHLSTRDLIFCHLVPPGFRRAP